MSDASPPPLRVPASLSKDRETLNYFLRLHRFLLQIWTELGGGSPGTVAAADDDVFELPRTVDTEPLERLLYALSVQPEREPQDRFWPAPETPPGIDLEPLSRLAHAMDALGLVNALTARLEALERRIESVDVQRHNPKIDELEALTYGSEF